jgi:hypothetical protein
VKRAKKEEKEEKESNKAIAFPNPLAENVLESYREYRFSDAVPDIAADIVPHNVVKLLVGDQISHVVESGQWLDDTIFDFRKNEIIVLPIESASSTLTSARLDTGRYFLLREHGKGTAGATVTRTRIPSAACVMVKRNPGLSKDMRDIALPMYKNTMQHGDQPATYEPIMVLGNGSSDAFEFCKLVDLPSDQVARPPPLFQAPPGMHDPPCTGYLLCFICGRLLKVPRELPAWGELERAQRNDTRSFHSHCRKHHANHPFWTTIPSHTEKGVRVVDRVQWCLEVALKQFRGLPLAPFVWAIDHNELFSLRCTLTKFFGFARGANQYSGNMRKLNAAKNAKVKGRIDNFKFEVAKALDSITNAFLIGNFARLAQDLLISTPLVDPVSKAETIWPGVTREALLVWNYTNIFFLRGMYMQPPFPFLTHLGKVSEATLADLAVATATTEPATITVKTELSELDAMDKLGEMDEAETDEAETDEAEMDETENDAEMSSEHI